MIFSSSSLGKGALRLHLRRLQLLFHIVKLLPALLQPLRKAVYHIVQTLDIAEHIRTQGNGIAELPLEGDDKLPFHAVKMKLHRP